MGDNIFFWARVLHKNTYTLYVACLLCEVGKKLNFFSAVAQNQTSETLPHQNQFLHCLLLMVLIRMSRFYFHGKNVKNEFPETEVTLKVPPPPLKMIDYIIP